MSGRGKRTVRRRAVRLLMVATTLMVATVAGGWLVPAGVADGAPAPVAGRGHAVEGRFPVRGPGQTQRTGLRAPAAGPDDAGTPPRGTRGFLRTSGVDVRTSGVDMDGLAQDGSVALPDVSAAAGPRYLVEAVNSRLAAFARAGTQRCELALATLFGAEVSGPRVLYDASYDRYAVAAGGGPDGTLHLAVTRGGDPCAAWWVYRVGFTGALFPAGTRLDHPYLAQDPQALLVSANTGPATAMAAGLPKAAFYAGTPVDVPAFAVASSAAPVLSTVAGDSYYLAAEPGVGYRLYTLLNSAGPGTFLLDDGTVPAPFAAPSRRARQCTGAGLDAGDGRITAPPVRVGDYVWFAHGVDAAGRPGIRYGALDLFTGAISVATAARSATSDDVNPSIGASDAGYGLNYVWLNWAATDPGAAQCANVAVVVDGVAPGDGVPDRHGTGLVLAQDGATATDAPFGGYSSVSADPVARTGCPAALAAQQYFDAAGRWRTRLARVAWC